jgi:hypothetical protein
MKDFVKELVLIIEGKNGGNGFHPPKELWGDEEKGKRILGGGHHDGKPNLQKALPFTTT